MSSGRLKYMDMMAGNDSDGNEIVDGLNLIGIISITESAQATSTPKKVPYNASATTKVRIKVFCIKQRVGHIITLALRPELYYSTY
jgi:hypothetical protein